jgi:hypothetical protein
MPEGFKPAAIVTATPQSFMAGDEITITFDAKQAWGNLTGAAKVYMHSGVVMSGPDGTDWTNTVGNWGQDDGVGEMKSIGNDKWQITLTPGAYYKVPADQQIFRLGMVFRDAWGNNTGRGPAGQDLFLDVKLPPLAAPSSLTATTAGLEVTLKWLDNAKTETGYIVERSPASGGTFVRLPPLPANSTSYTDTDVAQASYFYRVRAVGDGETQSLNSNQITVAVGAGFTVYFYRPAIWSGAGASIHFWNAAPGGSSTQWPGIAMVAAPEQGSNWFKYTGTAMASGTIRNPLN